MAVFGDPPPADVAGRQGGEALVDGRPAPDQVEGDDPRDDDAERQQDALQGIDVGHGAQAARGDVDEHDRGQDPHAQVLADDAVAEHAEQEARSAQLHAQVGDREQQGHDHGQDPDRVAAEVVGQHLARRDVAETLADDPLPLQEHHPRKGDRDGVEGRIGVLEPVAIDEPRMAHEGPSRERRRRRRQDEHPHRHAAPGDEVVARRLGLQRALDAPEDTVRPVQPDECKQPNNFCFHLCRLPSIGSGPTTTARWPAKVPARSGLPLDSTGRATHGKAANAPHARNLDRKDRSRPWSPASRLRDAGQPALANQGCGSGDFASSA